MAKILVTGGAGFIGSHLVERLLAEGIEVRVLDDLSSGKLEHLAAVLGHPRLRFVRGSVTDPGMLASLSRGVDWIFHLAAVVGVERVVEAPLDAQRELLHGTEAVLECARAQGCGVLLEPAEPPPAIT